MPSALWWGLEVVRYALTRLWPSYVLLTQLGDAIIRNQATWHRGTQHKAAKPRHMVAFNFRRKSN